MKKISTLYKKNPNDLGRVINEINSENNWVIEGYGIPTQKFDGTSVSIINGELYKRYDIKLWKKKKGKIIIFTKEQLQAKIPINAIACQEPDEKSGHWPHWVLCKREDNSNKYHFEAFDNEMNLKDGTYELCGEKIQGNPEKINGHKLIKHGSVILPITDFSFMALEKYLEITNIEGIVFHHKNCDKMCKIRKSDFGIKRKL